MEKWKAPFTVDNFLQFNLCRARLLLVLLLYAENLC